MSAESKKVIPDAETILSEYTTGWGYDQCEGVVFGSNYSVEKASAVQHPEEIRQFIDVLQQIAPEHMRLALETGLCKGGTHLIWKMMFDRVVSLERSAREAVCFMNGLKVKKGSTVVCTDSTLPISKLVVERMLEGQQATLLFIDGAHEYSSTESDYVNYESMVARGGVIAFHDTNPGLDNGPTKLVSQLESGEHVLLDAPLDIKHIHCNGQGISYYIKP